MKRGTGWSRSPTFSSMTFTSPRAMMSRVSIEMYRMREHAHTDSCMHVRVPGQKVPETTLSSAASLLPPISMEIEPGKVLAVVADGSQGKSVLMRLITRQLLPSEGFIKYPARWRVRLCNTYLLFDDTLLFNLQFGNNFPHPGVLIAHTAHMQTNARTRMHSRTACTCTPARPKIEKEIWPLCRRMGLSDKLIKHGQYQVGFAGEKLPISDRSTRQLLWHLFTITRADSTIYFFLSCVPHACLEASRSWLCRRIPHPRAGHS